MIRQTLNTRLNPNALNTLNALNPIAAQALASSNRRVFAGGNLGTPLSAAASAHLRGGVRFDAVVAEASSYQACLSLRIRCLCCPYLVYIRLSYTAFIRT